MTLIQEYFSLTRTYTEKYGIKTILLMQVGAFFEVYACKDNDRLIGSQIQDFSLICDLNIADKKSCVDEKNVVMAGFSVYMIDKYLKKLQDAGYTIAVHRQHETNVSERNLDCIYSPGTFFSQENIHITNNITCIWLNVVDISSSSTTFKQFIKPNQMNQKLVQVGISNINILTGKTTIFEFKESYINNPTTFDELERFISIYHPSEVIIISENLSGSEVDDIIQYSSIQCSCIHKLNLNEDILSDKKREAQNCEKQTYQLEILNKFYKSVDTQYYFENIYSTQSFCYLLNFIYQHNPNLLHKIEEPVFEKCSDRLILANHSLKQLNIIQDHYQGKFSSIEKLLNLCITSMGKRHFSHLLLNPTTRVEYLQEEYNITSYILSKNNFSVRNKMINIKDLSKINRQVVMKKISPKTIYLLYHNLKLIEELFSVKDETIMEYLNKREVDSNTILYCKEIIDFFDKTLDIQKCDVIDTLSQFEDNFILKGVDSYLDEKFKTYLESQDKLFAIKKFFNEKIKKFEKKENDYIKIHETEKTIIRIIATKRRCSLLKEELSKDKRKICILTYESSFTGREEIFELSYDNISFEKQNETNQYILFSQLNDICKNITDIKTNMKDVITNVYYQNIIEKLNEHYFQKITSISSFITFIDIIYTKAYIANKYNYCCPEIDVTHEKSYFNAVAMRHPLIECLQTNEFYVTNDIQLGREKDDGILLYGTNAVGKTSFIRAIGICIIMAQSGLFVPCSSFIYKPYEYIFTRILGNDNIFKGLSTFAVEMSELRSILRLSNENSLILGDELCSGTESISAKSIFVAGVQSLSNKKSSFIFATHLHEIIDYEEIKTNEFLSLKHMSVHYDREKDILVYDRKLKNGPGNNMYGLEVCRSLNLPKDFLELANSIRIKYDKSSSILSLKESKYNNKKIRSICEECKEEYSTEVHHINPQKMADENGFIKRKDGSKFHKNHLANLMALCEKCHKKMHYNKIDLNNN
jgi:DNA mismatch repair protein MutS